MLTIWGRLNSINVQKVLWCADEIGIEYERIDAGMEYGVVDTEAYLAINPGGKVPTIRDGDDILWESAAIVRYLAARYGDSEIYPESPMQRGHADQWADWNAWWIHPPLTTAFWGLVRSPEKFTPEQVEQAKTQLADSWQMLEKTLERQPFVAGDRLSYGDIVPGCSWYRYQVMVTDRPHTPALDDWYARLAERKAFQDRVMLPLR